MLPIQNISLEHVKKELIFFNVLLVLHWKLFIPLCSWNVELYVERIWMSPNADHIYNCPLFFFKRPWGHRLVDWSSTVTGPVNLLWPISVYLHQSHSHHLLSSPYSINSLWCSTTHSITLSINSLYFPHHWWMISI